MLPGAGCKSAKYKFLDEGIHHSNPCGDQESLEHQPRTAVGFRIVEVGDGPGGKIASQAGVIRLQLPVVSPADKWTEHRVTDAGALCARALVEVTRVLAEKGGKD